MLDRNLTSAPLLSETEERRLVRLAQRGDLTARDRLVASNMRLVIKLAQPYTSSGLPIEDLVQWGSIGLLRALKTFNQSSGNRFMTYAGGWVRQALSRAVDNHAKHIRLPSYVCEYARKINKARTELKQYTGVTPDNAELAHKLGWSEPKLRKILSQLGDTVSLDDPLGDTTIGALLEDNSTGPEEQLMLTTASCDVLDLLSTLNAAEREVLLQRMQDRRHEDVHTSLHISRARVEDLEAVAVQKLADRARTKILERIETGG